MSRVKAKGSPEVAWVAMPAGAARETSSAVLAPVPVTSPTAESAAPRMPVAGSAKPTMFWSRKVWIASGPSIRSWKLARSSRKGSRARPSARTL